MASLSAQERGIVAGQASIPEVASSRRSKLGGPTSGMGQEQPIFEVGALSAFAITGHT